MNRPRSGRRAPILSSWGAVTRLLRICISLCACGSTFSELASASFLAIFLYLFSFYLVSLYCRGAAPGLRIPLSAQKKKCRSRCSRFSLLLIGENVF